MQDAGRGGVGDDHEQNGYELQQGPRDCGRCGGGAEGGLLGGGGVVGEPLRVRSISRVHEFDEDLGG
jgi:hypothetical protein